MAGGRSDRAVRSWRGLVLPLWIGAAVIVALGFLLRPLARLFGGHELRFASAGVIAAGIAVALLGWVVEKLTRLPPER